MSTLKKLDKKLSCDSNYTTMREEMSVWGGDGDADDTGGGLLEVVLREVFSWLSAPQLAAVSAVCREWRRAALDPALWRHLLEPLALRGALRALAAHAHSECGLGVEWRAEYARVCGAWEQRGLIRAAGAPLVHAALSECGSRLALVDEAAYVAVWVRHQRDGWEARWACDLRSDGWAAAVRTQWPPRAPHRLLVTGRVALAERWELAVVELREGEARVSCRAGCSAGAAGCWAGADAFVSLELRLLESFAVTGVWVNAASQRVADEHEGVAAPLFHIYNEANAHLTHALVVEEEEEEEGSEVRCWLVAACGEMGEEGQRGVATALAAWPLPTRAPAAVVARASLPERLARHRAERASTTTEPQPADETAVRALCTPPSVVCSLGARIVGLVADCAGRCLWASTSVDGAGVRLVCVSATGLRPLRELYAPSSSPALLEAHYAQPAASASLVGSPAGGGSGQVWMWGAASGARRPSPLPHPAPALVLLLPSTAPLLTALVLTPQALHTWTSRAPP